MRNKGLPEKWVLAIWVLIIDALILWLAFSNQLSLYINPDYIPWTVLASVVSGAVVSIHAVSDGLTWKRAKPAIVGIGVFAAVLMLAVPSKPLTVALDNDAASQSSVSQAADKTKQEAPKEKLSLEGQTVIDTNVYEVSKPDGEASVSNIKVGDYVSFVGEFIPSDTEGWGFIARNMVFCCVVDATPINIAVNADDMEPHQWFKVSGQLVRDGDFLYLDVAESVSVEAPAEPYLFFADIIYG